MKVEVALLPVSRIRFGFGPDPIRFRFSTDGPDHTVRNRPGSDLVMDGHVRLWPSGSVPEASRCARIIGPGSSKTEPARFWQNAPGPDPIWLWMAMLGCGQADQFRKQAGVQESSGPVPANRFRAGSVAGSVAGFSMFTG